MLLDAIVNPWSISNQISTIKIILSYLLPIPVVNALQKSEHNEIYLPTYQITKPRSVKSMTFFINYFYVKINSRLEVKALIWLRM
jgi:hypothetical protein